MGKRINIWSIIVFAVVMIAIFGTAPLVISHWTHGEICPKILGVPACYIVLVCFLTGLTTHLFSSKKANLFFFIFISLVTLIASYGTMGELFGFAECPRTSSGIPMCFISMSICVTLIISKSLYIRSNRT